MTPYYGVFWFVIVSPIIWLFLIKFQLFLKDLDLSFAKHSSLDHLHLELILSQTLIAWWLGTKTWRIYLIILSRNLSFSADSYLLSEILPMIFLSLLPSILRWDRKKLVRGMWTREEGMSFLAGINNMFIMWLNVCFWAKSPYSFLLWFMVALLYSPSESTKMKSLDVLCLVYFT